MGTKYVCKCGIKTELLGLSEFAEKIGWSPAKINNQLKRQLHGAKARIPLPLPISQLSCGPIWTLAQAEEFLRLEEGHSNED